MLLLIIYPFIYFLLFFHRSHLNYCLGPYTLLIQFNRLFLVIWSKVCFTNWAIQLKNFKTFGFNFPHVEVFERAADGLIQSEVSQLTLSKIIDLICALLMVQTDFSNTWDEWYMLVQKNPNPDFCSKFRSTPCQS